MFLVQQINILQFLKIMIIIILPTPNLQKLVYIQPQLSKQIRDKRHTFQFPHIVTFRQMNKNQGDKSKKCNLKGYKLDAVVPA